MKRIFKNKLYKVTKYYAEQKPAEYFGVMSGEDVRLVVSYNYKYDDNYDMYFSKSGNIGFSVVEV